MPQRASTVSSDLSDAFARCRTLGHSWDPIPVTRPSSWGATLELRCEHCHTVRRDVLDPRNGEMFSRHYIYPDHYRDPERHVRSDWRALYVTTLEQTLVSLRPLKAVKGGRK